MSKPTRFSQGMIDDYLARGYWARTTFADFLEQNAQLYPGQEAFVDSRKRLTWKEVKLLSDRLAFAFLERQIPRDEVAVAILPNIWENAVLRLALEKAGIVSLFVPLTARRTEIDRILQIAGATVCVLLREYRGVDYLELLEASPFKKNLKHIFILGSDRIKGTISLDEVMEKATEREFPEDRLKARKFTFFEVSLIQLTSGSTGIPKLCEWPIAPSVLFGRTFIQRGGIEPGDIIGALAPLSGGPGVMAWMAGPQIPAPTIFLDHFEPEEALRLIERERITVACAVPTQVIRMAAHPNLRRYDLRSLRVIRVGGAALSNAVAEEIEDKLGCFILPAAGCSECMSIGHTSLLDSRFARLGTVGKPWLYNEVKILDTRERTVQQGEIGEIAVRGACTASGFYKDMETTREVWGGVGEDGWCRTGDLGKMDLEGNIVLVGRVKDIIIRGGQNIYPREIEILLSTHPNVMDVAVVPVPDSDLGEKVCACVILKPGGRLSFIEMVAFLKAKEIAMYKIPERLEIVEKFPMIVDGGKVDKVTLSRNVIENG